MAIISFLLLVSGLMPNYEVKLGLGMHLGYAIEGPIGSYYKIDASYLSPNVRMSERLESATKQYGVPILFSGELYEHFSTETQVECRQVDYVMMVGVKEPVKFFTIDLDSSSIQFDAEENNMSMKE
jgi:class 3 adenylate cyclase